MNIYIDLHMVANVIALVTILALCVVWALFSRRVVSLLAVVGACLTIFVASHSDPLDIAHIESVLIGGGVLTGLLVFGFVLVRASLRRRRLHPRARRSDPVALHLAEKPARRERRRAAVPMAAPVEREYYEEYDDQAYDDGTLVGYAEPEYFVEPEVRQPQRHSAGSRARAGGAGQSRQYNRAARARLQQGGR